jgi:putative transcriptional regulator
MPKKTDINRIRVILAEKQVTQKELAKMVKRTPHTISRICTNDHQPTLTLLRDIALALNVNVQELLEPTPVKPNK